MAVADTADELLEEIPRLEKKKRNYHVKSKRFWGKKGRRDSSEPPKFEEVDDHLILAEPAGAADPVEELTAGGVLHDDGEVRGREHDLEKKREHGPQMNDEQAGGEQGGEKSFGCRLEAA